MDIKDMNKNYTPETDPIEEGNVMNDAQKYLDDLQEKMDAAEELVNTTAEDLDAAKDATPKYNMDAPEFVPNEEPVTKAVSTEDIDAAISAAPVYNSDAPVAEPAAEPAADPSLAETAEIDSENLAAEIRRAKPDYTEPWREPTYTATTDNVRPYSPSRYEGAAAYTPRKAKRKKSGFARVAAMALAMALICGLAGGGAAYLVTNTMLKDYEPVTASSAGNQVVIGGTTTESKSNGESSSAQSVSVTGETLSASQIYDLATEQVVGVNTSINTTNMFGQSTSSAVSGSGFIISADGYIMTNYHVIEYAAVYGYDLSVIMYDGTSYPAEIIGYESENDVAVIKIDATGLNPVTFGKSENMVVGEDVYAVGNPLGELEFTMTKGMVSALDRYVTTDANTSINMFQIDAAVNNGNSGGPVYNSRGEVIGIVTAKYSSTGVEGIGFAIPIDDAVTISTQLIEKGYVSGKAFLGVNVQDITETYAIYLNLPQGAYVYSLTDGSCAQAAGVRVGDVITAVGNYSVTSTAELKSALTNFSSGDTTTLTVYRSGDYETLTVTFDEKGASTGGSVQNDLNPQSPQNGQDSQSGENGQNDQSQQGGSYNDFDIFGNGNSGGFWQMP